MVIKACCAGARGRGVVIPAMLMLLIPVSTFTM